MIGLENNPQCVSLFVFSAASPGFERVTANGSVSGKSQFLCVVIQSWIRFVWSECFLLWPQKLRSRRVCWPLKKYPLGRSVARAKHITLNSFRCPGLLNGLLGNVCLK